MLAFAKTWRTTSDSQQPGHSETNSSHSASPLLLITFEAFRQETVESSDTQCYFNGTCLLELGNPELRREPWLFWYWLCRQPCRPPGFITRAAISGSAPVPIMYSETRLLLSAELHSVAWPSLDRLWLCLSIEALVVLLVLGRLNGAELPRTSSSCELSQYRFVSWAIHLKQDKNGSAQAASDKI